MYQSTFKLTCLIFLSLLLSKVVNAETKHQISPVGFWTTISDEDNKPRSVVQIKQINDKIEAVILKVYSKSKDHSLCINCQGKLKNAPIVGMRFMWDLEASNERRWSGGKILDPKNGKTYKCKIELDKSGKKLLVRGYYGISLFGRTQTWIRRSSVK